ncbi:MAG: LCP family protein [Candidatus Obscuribacterales bacterium]|nr:LCP family protein [Candidatus Obscuribacterales bacterium]
MIIKSNTQARSIPWKPALLACLLVSAGISLFCLTCKPQARQVLTRFSPKMNFGQAAAIADAQNPVLPSLDLIPKLSQKMTILLMGVDSNGQNTDPFQGTRSDTMMLVSIDPLENKVGVISIPRDSRVRIPNHGVDKINSAHAYGGAELSMQTVREAFSVPVDHYIEVDTGGLKKLFEILGPVEVLVEKEMKYVDHSGKLNVDLKAGLQTLSPAQTEEYVRFRHDARGDIGRIERQQWFVRQAAKKFKEPEIVLKLPQLVYLAYQCVRTDLPVQDVMSIAAYAKDFPHERVVTAMLPGEAQMISGGSYWVPDAIASQAVFSRILACSVSNPPPVTASTDAPAAQELSMPEDEMPATAPGLSTDFTKAATVAIKYPKGAEQLSLAIAEQLSEAGFKVRYRWQIADVDCQHELLVGQSNRANDEETNKLIQAIPELQSFPQSLAIESRPSSDFTIIISAASQMPSICHNVGAPNLQAKTLPLNVSASVTPILPQD